MRLQTLFLAILIAFAFSAGAQSSDYRVARDSAGQFLLFQNGSKTAFDTAYVASSLASKTKEEAAVKAEIELLERLILLRRQLAVISDERKTLEEILKKARNATP